MRLGWDEIKRRAKAFSEDLKAAVRSTNKQGQPSTCTWPFRSATTNVYSEQKLPVAPAKAGDRQRTPTPDFSFVAR